MNHAPYPAASGVAPAVRAHFLRNAAYFETQGEKQLAPIPDEATIAEIIDVAFWSSLRREEGISPEISLAYLPVEQADGPLTFARPLPFQPAALARLAPAVQRPGIHLGVWRINGDLFVWGTTQQVPGSTFVLEVIRPGLLVVKRRRVRTPGKYVNIAVLQGDQISIVDENSSGLAGEKPLIAGLLGFDSARAWTDPVNTVVQLATSMRAHGRGGSLLIVPSGSDSWQDSMVRPMAYALRPPFEKLAELMRKDVDKDDSAWREAVRKSVDMIGGLTAVDGATVINDQYELLAFGTKIRRNRDEEAVQKILVSAPVAGAAADLVEVSRMGGTRHLSAAQFVHDQPASVALVASQDGGFTAMAWSPSESIVHAYRVETLLY